LNEVIESQKQKIGVAPAIDENGNSLIFILSPGDLVFIPNKDEIMHNGLVKFESLNSEQVKRIYKFVSCTGSEGHFVPNNYAKEIISNENGSNNKNERMLNFDKSLTIIDENLKPVMIKSICWKVEVNRIGLIKKTI
jgi:CRISPR-associated endonuclease Csn1